MQLFSISWFWKLKKIFEEAVDILSTDTAIVILLTTILALAIIAVIVVLVVFLLRLTAIALLALRIVSDAMAQSRLSRIDSAKQAPGAKPPAKNHLEGWLKILMKYLL